MGDRYLMGISGYELFCAANQLNGQELLIPGTEQSSGLVVITLEKYQRLVKAVSEMETVGTIEIKR